MSECLEVISLGFKICVYHRYVSSTKVLYLKKVCKGTIISILLLLTKSSEPYKSVQDTVANSLGSAEQGDCFLQHDS